MEHDVRNRFGGESRERDVAPQYREAGWPGMVAPERPAYDAMTPEPIRAILRSRPGEKFVDWRCRVNDELTVLADQLGGRATQPFVNGTAPDAQR
jgi:hypothetical protein